MGRFSEQFIHQVGQANDIVEVIGQYIALKKRGKEFVGLCPFHEDHRPSLNVSPSKQIFKCFSCGAGGGVFQFLMQHHRHTFPEAVRELAERVGIPVPAEEAAAEGDRALSAESLLKLTTFAARFFRDRLLGPSGAAALAYARGRQLTDESIRRFGLGYAPDSWDALRSAALGAGFTDRQLAAAGVGAQREDGSCYDRFRNRLMFPILDVGGKVIAFGGRALDEQERAKYLNSPETVLFDKSANLYGLTWARQEIINADRAVVVEGYLDALMCLQAGIGNVVATLGTALTERHVRILRRYAGDVVLVFDADAAGQAASERAMELFLTQRVNVRVATVAATEEDQTGGSVKDPYDYVVAAGAEAMRRLVDEAPDALAYAWSRRRQEYLRTPTLAGKQEILEEFLRLVVSSSAYGAIDTLREALVVGQIGELVGLPPADVAGQMRRIASRVRRASGAVAATSEQAPQGADRAERWLLGVLLNEPAMLEAVRDRIRPDMFLTPLLKAVAEQVWRLAEEDRLDMATLLIADETQQWGRLVADLQVAGESLGNYERTLEDAAEHMLRRDRQEQLRQMRATEGLDSPDLMRRISEEGRKPDRRRRPRIT